MVHFVGAGPGAPDLITVRDNMVIYKEQLVLRDLHYALIDEVDSVLIDEARTPLIISGCG